MNEARLVLHAEDLSLLQAALAPELGDAPDGCTITMDGPNVHIVAPSVGDLRAALNTVLRLADTVEVVATLDHKG